MTLSVSAPGCSRCGSSEGISSGEISSPTTDSQHRAGVGAELLGVDRPAEQELDQRLGHRGVDVVVRHLVADAVGGPAERQLGQVAGAEHDPPVVVGQAEQVRGPLAGLDVLVGDVVLGLAARRPGGRGP